MSPGVEKREYLEWSGLCVVSKPLLSDTVHENRRTPLFLVGGTIKEDNLCLELGD